MENTKVINLTPQEVQIIVSESKYRDFRLEQLKQLAFKIDEDFSDVVKTIVRDFHQETAPENMIIKIDEKTKKPYAIEWVIN